ncbi:hypothetical protein LRS73_17900 [Methylobacterium currus]|uniref:hypothetical protein n=1 Tax=Methylobacterium currus TaxID=2051553 RepID=UPI001E2A1055|nr:hypothetical protein [Methylobacterium currus]UHC19192.1 hypothetical protein LRS73_17900 [Methylobacterium currus]
MMGLTPRQVDALTLPEMLAMLEGFRRFHGGEDEAPAPSLDAFLRALAEHERARA